MPNKNKQGGQPGAIPENLINQINEWSAGGFILFIKNADGDISVIPRYDSTVDKIGLEKFIQVWGNVNDSITENEIAAKLIGMDPDDMDPDDMGQMPSD